MKITVNSQESLSHAIGLLRETFRDKKYFQVAINTGKKRSLDQNAISHAWYLQISREEREYKPEQVKCLCKYHLGLPILRGEDEEFNALCAAVIDVLPYEDKIKAMIYMPVTSIMSVKQKNEYLLAIQDHYAGRVILGNILK